MARLILSLDGQVLAEYNMTKERYTIGRLPDNDVRIDNPAVSGHHSLIINILNDSFLEDLNSTNGTYVNGKLIKKHALQHDDVITVGHHQLRYVDDRAVEEPSDDEFEKTMVLEASGRVERHVSEAVEAAAQGGAPEPQPAPAPSRAPGAAAAQSREAFSPTTTQNIDEDAAPAVRLAKLQVLSGQFAGRELELKKALTTLGRPGVQVAAVTRRADGYFIVHVESGKEGDYPRVNGMSIGPQARRLDDNDVIQLAGVKMGFFLD